MGSKLILSGKDSFLNEEEDLEEVSGIVGGCYCCSKNIHVTFNHLEASPVAQIDKDFFYIIICDQCEDDIMLLKDNGVDKVSYDVLWLIQENLATELYNLSLKTDDDVNSDIRDALVIKLYKEAEKKIENKSTAKYLSKLTFNDQNNKK